MYETIGYIILILIGLLILIKIVGWAVRFAIKIGIIALVAFLLFAVAKGFLGL